MAKLSTLNLIAVIFFLFGLAGIVYALIRKISGIRAARKGEPIRFRQGTQIFLPFGVMSCPNPSSNASGCRFKCRS